MERRLKQLITVPSFLLLMPLWFVLACMLYVAFGEETPSGIIERWWDGVTAHEA